MKRLLLTLLALFAALSFNACTRDEKTALEEFKKDFASFKAFAAEKRKSAEATGGAAIGAANKEILARIKAIRADGLPADLKEPWVASVAGLDKDAAVSPSDPAYMTKKIDILKSIVDEQDKLMAAGKKYGIDGLEDLTHQ